MRNTFRAILVTMMLSGMAGAGFASSATFRLSATSRLSGTFTSSWTFTSLTSLEDSVPGLNQRILYSILDLQFNEADSMLSLFAEQNSADPEYMYLENYLEFLEAFISGDIGSFQDYQEASGIRIESIRDVKKELAGSFYALSAIHLQSSVLCAYHNEMFRAAKHLYYANRFLRQGEEAEVGNTRKFRNRGILILISASVPEEYQWLLKVFGFSGKIEEGFGYLEEYYTFSTGADRLEAYLLLDYAGLTLAPDNKRPENPGYSGDLTDSRYSGDPADTGNGARTLTLYCHALTDLSSGNSQEVVKYLGTYHQDLREREFPYLDLLLGEALLNQLDPVAEESFQKFNLKNSGVHYRHYTWHKLGWSFALQGDWKLYNEARQKVLQIGEPILDADRQALSEAMDSLPLNITLLKARLLFDGGDYAGALGILADSSGIPLLNQRDSLEFPYRKARILDKLGERDRAIESYGKVIEEGSGQSWYFAPNAALHLGMIYEEQGDQDRALEYYRKCLKINNSSYKQSIDYKARQGIRRLDR